MNIPEAKRYLDSLPAGEHVVVLRPAHTRKVRKGKQKRFQVPEPLADDFEDMLDEVGSCFGNKSREVEVSMVIGIVRATITEELAK